MHLPSLYATAFLTDITQNFLLNTVLFSCVDPWLLSVITTIIWECNCCWIMADNPPGAPRHFLVTVPELTVSRECRSKKFIPAVRTSCAVNMTRYHQRLRRFCICSLISSGIVTQCRWLCRFRRFYSATCLHADVSFGLLGPDDHGFVIFLNVGG